MKVFWISLCMLWIGFLSANQDIYTFCGDDYPEICCPNWSLELRVAAFIPTNNRVRKIYSNGWPEYQIQLGKRLCRNWQVFAEFSGFQKSGHSSLGSKTKLSVFPLSLGIKYLFPLYSNLDVYVGGGVAYSWLRIKDDSPYVHRHVRKEQFGGIIKTGLIYTFCNCWFIDVFADYLFQRFSFRGVSCDPFVTRQTADVSGFKIGGGIGYNF